MLLSRRDYIEECTRMLKELSWKSLRLAYIWIQSSYEMEARERDEERNNAEGSAMGTPTLAIREGVADDTKK